MQWPRLHMAVSNFVRPLEIHGKVAMHTLKAQIWFLPSYPLGAGSRYTEEGVTQTEVIGTCPGQMPPSARGMELLQTSFLPRVGKTETTLPLFLDFNFLESTPRVISRLFCFFFQNNPSVRQGRNLLTPSCLRIEDDFCIRIIQPLSTANYLLWFFVM